MNNFRFYNPTEIVFGKGTIAAIDERIPKKAKVMLVYGGGSIKKNGVYDQVMKALNKRKVIEFGGVEPNPDYETLLKALKLIKKKEVDFLLAVGGGSVIDGTKFLALASFYKGDEPWDLLGKGKASKVKNALPYGAVLTLPATSSEFNRTSVISYRSKGLKISFVSDLVFPQFSILDPEVTYSLPAKQLRNGLVDAFIHVIENYLTYPAGNVFQDRQSEALLLTLREIAPKTMQMDPPDYDIRANYMWAVSNSLNYIVGMGTPQDWATHGIGHELTALYGLDHAESLAVVLPWLLWYKREQKWGKLLQYGERIFGITEGSEEERVDQAIHATSTFFQSLGMPTTLTAFGIDPDKAAKKVAKQLLARNVVRGEHKDIDGNAAAEILRLSR